MDAAVALGLLWVLRDNVRAIQSTRAQIAGADAPQTLPGVHVPPAPDVPPVAVLQTVSRAVPWQYNRLSDETVKVSPYVYKSML
jgi:hypothetical protein